MPPGQVVDGWNRCFRAGLVELRSDDPRAVYRNRPPRPCLPLPGRRPADFEVQLSSRGHEPDPRRPRLGLSAGVCHFEWTFPLPKSAVGCAVPQPAVLDALYRDLRALQLHAVKVRRLERFSPHRGGESLTFFWADGHCEIADVLMYEVAPKDRPRFQKAVERFRETWRSAARP